MKPLKIAEEEPEHPPAPLPLPTTSTGPTETEPSTTTSPTPASEDTAPADPSLEMFLNLLKKEKSSLEISKSLKQLTPETKCSMLEQVLTRDVVELAAPLDPRINSNRPRYLQKTQEMIQATKLQRVDWNLLNKTKLEKTRENRIPKKVTERKGEKWDEDKIVKQEDKNEKNENKNDKMMMDKWGEPLVSSTIIKEERVVELKNKSAAKEDDWDDADDFSQSSTRNTNTGSGGGCSGGGATDWNAGGRTGAGQDFGNSDRRGRGRGGDCSWRGGGSGGRGRGYGDRTPRGGFESNRGGRGRGITSSSDIWGAPSSNNNANQAEDWGAAAPASKSSGGDDWGATAIPKLKPAGGDDWGASAAAPVKSTGDDWAAPKASGSASGGDDWAAPTASASSIPTPKPKATDEWGSTDTKADDWGAPAIPIPTPKPAGGGDDWCTSAPAKSTPGGDDWGSPKGSGSASDDWGAPSGTKSSSGGNDWGASTSNAGDDWGGGSGSSGGGFRGRGGGRGGRDRGGGGRGGGQDRDRSGDWACLDCDWKTNFSWRRECYRCKKQKPEDGSAPSPTQRSGSGSGGSFGGSRDWGSQGSGNPNMEPIAKRSRMDDWGNDTASVCSNKSTHSNGSDKDTRPNSVPGNSGSGGSVVGKKPMSEWTCPDTRCGSNNFDWRQDCFRCGANKNTTTTQEYSVKQPEAPPPPPRLTSPIKRIFYHDLDHRLFPPPPQMTMNPPFDLRSVISDRLKDRPSSSTPKRTHLLPPSPPLPKTTTITKETSTPPFWTYNEVSTSLSIYHPHCSSSLPLSYRFEAISQNPGGGPTTTPSTLPPTPTTTTTTSTNVINKKPDRVVTSASTTVQAPKTRNKVCSTWPSFNISILIEQVKQDTIENELDQLLDA